MQQLSATHKQQARPAGGSSPCRAEHALHMPAPWLHSSEASIQQQARAHLRAAVTTTTACQQAAQISRRDALVASLLACSSFCAVPPALASVPEVAAAGQWGLPFSLPAPPEPVRFPRKALNLRFAVLLMRSGFDAVNALDFIPMDKFEAKFWKLRQSELEGYNLLYAPLKPRQGDLTDPLYFDFISFSQFATISREMGTPLKLFNEYKEVCPPGAGEDDPCEAGTQVVARPEQFADDAQLPQYFFNTAGDLMYQGLLNGFQGETFGGPAPPKADASIQQLAAGVQQLLDCMVAKGYAISAAVTDVQPGSTSAGSAAGGSFSVTINGPCNLWAVSALKARNSKVINAYDVMVTAAWMRAGGFSAAPEVELLESGLAQRWTIL